jgi:hypothetical protein
MKKWFLACLVLQGLMVGSAHAVLQSPNSLIGGLTVYDLRDYENLYDSNGAIVTNRVAQAGDTLQGVFVITAVSNQPGTAFYAPQVAGNVELTGIFDEKVLGVDPAGNFQFVPDNTSGTTAAKPMSGTQFQSTYGSGAMIAVFYNNINAMPIQTNNNGLNGLTAAQALSLATTNGGQGTLWATFGAKGTWGAPGGYFWAANQQTAGVATFAASLGFINNATGIPTNLFAPITQAPPAGFGGTDGALFTIPNVFNIQGTTNPSIPGSSNDLSLTPYTVFSTDPARINFIPEPTSALAMGGLFGLWALGLAAYRRIRKA